MTQRPIKDKPKEELLTIILDKKKGSMYKEAAIFELVRRTEVFKSQKRLYNPKIADKEYKIAVMEIYNNVKEDFTK